MNNKMETVIVAILILGAASMTTSLASGAIALANATFLGESGDQRGTGIEISGDSAYISIITSANDNDGFIANLSLPSLSWQWYTGPWPGVSGSDEFFDVAVTGGAVYTAGNSYSQTTDNVGGKEVKSVLVKYLLSGSSVVVPPSLLAKPNFFSYTGTESFQSVATAVEGSSTVLYAAGGGQPCSYYAYIIAKFDTSGNLLNNATESIAGIDFNACVGGYDKSSGANAVTLLNGNIYVAGNSNYPDSVGRPVVWKHDSNLNMIWRQRDTSMAGSFQGITAFSGYIYAVGYTHTPGVLNSENYLIQKYDESGNLSWSQTSGGSNTDVLTGIVGIGNRLFAVGYTRSQGAGGADAVVLEIDPATGTTLSSTLYGGAQDDMANGAATDGTDLYVVGESKSFAQGFNVVGQNDVMLLRYTVTGLVGEWRFDGNAQDSSGNGNHGTIYGATYVQGASGQALSFDGNDYVEISDSTSLDITSAITIEAWIYPKAVGDGNYHHIVDKYYSGTGYALRIEPSGKIAIDVNGWLESDIAIPGNQWSYVVGVSDGTYSKIYLNGQLIKSGQIASPSGSIQTNNYPLRIGCWAGDLTQCFNGTIDEVRIYNRALVDSEIQANYNALVDVTPPTISISSPSNGQSFTTSNITVSGTASDNLGLGKVEVKVGTGSWQLATGTTSWSKQVTLSLGSNTIYARANDTFGNTAESSVTVSYNPSVITIGNVTGGGRIPIPIAISSKGKPPQNGKATFGFVAHYTDGATTPSGNLEYNDHVVGLKVHGNVTTLSVDKRTNTSIFSGTAKITSTTGTIIGTYTVTAVDNGDPGKNDIFGITLSTGYAAGPTKLGGGNIQLHDP